MTPKKLSLFLIATLAFTFIFAGETKSAFADELTPALQEAPVEMQKRPQPKPRPKPGPREGGADD